MIVTSGPCSLPSRTSADLQLFLANRLRARAGSLGCTLYKLTWKERATPLQRSISALQGSVHRTCASDSTSLPSDLMVAPSSPSVCVRAWPTPTANDAKGSAYSYSQGDHDRPCLKLVGAARLASWATPATKEAGGTPEQFLRRKERARANGSVLGISLTSLSLQAQLAEHGQTLTGSSVPTKKSGQLNPEHSRWLMGLPRAWDESAPVEMRSSRRKPPK